MKDLALEVLKDIRAELGGLSERVDGLGDRVERVEKRLVESEIRLATELVAVVTAVREVRDVLIEDRALRSQVLDHEVRIQRLERRPRRLG